MTIDPEQTYVVLAADGGSAALPGGEAFWSRSAAELDSFGQGWLVNEYVFETDWPNWEMHPHGDELVYLLDGAIEIMLELPEGLRSVHLEGRGAVLVPRDVWHTAKVARPSRVLHLTRGAGTQHRPVLPAAG